MDPHQPNNNILLDFIRLIFIDRIITLHLNINFEQNCVNGRLVDVRNRDDLLVGSVHVYATQSLNTLSFPPPLLMCHIALVNSIQNSLNNY